MTELFAHPERAEMWLDRDYEAALEGYTAAVDWPVCSVYSELHDMFPDAKVVMTIRKPQSWARSMQDTILNLMLTRKPSEKVKSFVEIAQKFHFRTLRYGIEYDDLVRTYREHAVEVRNSVQDVISYWVGSGWEPLEQITGKKAPCLPFPHANDTFVFHHMFMQPRYRGDAMSILKRTMPRSSTAEISTAIDTLVEMDWLRLANG